MTRWDVIAVIEELSWLEEQYQQGKDPDLVPHNSDLWGDNYFLDAELFCLADNNCDREKFGLIADPLAMEDLLL